MRWANSDEDHLHRLVTKMWSTNRALGPDAFLQALDAEPVRRRALSLRLWA